MEFQAINRNDAERGVGTWTNISGTTITLGQSGHLATAAASNTGYGVVDNKDANSIRGFVGIALSNVPNTAVGRFTTYGYAASVETFALGTSITITRGDPLGPGAVNASLGVSSAGLTTAYGPVIALETITVSAGTYVKGWVRAM